MAPVSAGLEAKMDSANVRIRAAGTTLVAGGILFAVVFVLHGPLQPTVADQMHAIEGMARWSPIHWMAAAALSLLAMAGLIALTARSRLTETVATTIAWAVIPVGAVWTLMTAVAEATAVTQAAASGNQAIFESWWAFSAGLANGFVLLALGVAVVAAHEARTAEPAMPKWLSWIGAAVAVLSVAGWILGSWIGFQPGSPLWVASSLMMCLWLAWLGFTLARAGTTYIVAGSPMEQK
jgi:hypothetical protein